MPVPQMTGLMSTMGVPSMASIGPTEFDHRRHGGSSLLLLVSETLFEFHERFLPVAPGAGNEVALGRPC